MKLRAKRRKNKNEKWGGLHMNLLRGLMVSVITFVLTMFVLFAAGIGSSVSYTDKPALPIAISLVVGFIAALGSGNKQD